MLSAYTVDKGAEVFHNQEEANAFCRSNPEFIPTSMHISWQGKVRCRHCKVAGWVKDVHIGKHWAHKHGANCKKKPRFVITQNSPNITYTVNTNKFYGTTASSSGTVTYKFYQPWGYHTYGNSSYITISGV